MIQTKIMGIINATPDSFFPESRRGRSEDTLMAACSYGKFLEKSGADLVDIGGESTRPGASSVPLAEELQRVIPLIKELKNHLKIPLSIDTMKPEVAAAAVEAGVTFINDVSGFISPEMRALAASFSVQVCAVHGSSLLTVEKNAVPKEGIVQSILRWFEEVVTALIQSGVKEKFIILDPGIGFGGKTVADNFEILRNLPQLKAFGFPILLGISRKSFMGRFLDLPPSELLPATLALNSLAIEAGVDYIRVHDVKEHKEAAVLLHELFSTRELIDSLQKI
ncbi:MAG: dihydropteroate synthase [Parachlamydiaceae bacterium]|nr:dihydropteroate synthase [Parachlamydiaceae bacterium]